MQEPIIIRPMQPEDQGAVARLFHDVWHETQSHLQDARRGRHRNSAFFEHRVMERAACTLAAMAGSELAGFVCWTEGTLNSLFVSPDRRSRGVGEALLRQAEAHMAEAGATTFTLDCLVGNVAARRFYERHGWRADGERYWEDETPEGPAWARSWVMHKP